MVKLEEGVNRLPRGGYLVPTSEGYIQFGSPPETIKDTMGLPEKVPRIFILMNELFSVEKGIAVAEVEFPLYYNHFLRQLKSTIITKDIEQKNRLLAVLQESVFGPAELDLRSEFPDGEKSATFPDLRKEMDYFRGNRQLSDLVDFGTFENNEYRVGEVLVKDLGDAGFEVYDKGELSAVVPYSIDYHVKYDVGARLPEPFEAPAFGITCLGPSHGFDPEENTSGFILWVNHRGIMIDPPVNSTEWLRKSNVNPRLIHHVILTHCHADHDAGTFQKILDDSQITIHTTETVMDSFMRKYTSLTAMHKSQLYELFHFNPVMVEKPVRIEGAEFTFHYTLHSIPAIGFRMQFRNQSFIYTSDHLNHPPALDKINEAGVFTEGRYRFLRDFPWHYNVIYHEAGIPPLHTPVSYLASLPEEVQKKVTVYHIASKDFPEDSSLRLAKFGIENTLYPELEPVQHAEAIQLLDVMANVDLFSDFPIMKAREFLSVVKKHEYRKGERIIEKGDPGDSFFVILSGSVEVQGVDTKFKKTYGKYEYFGEASLVTGEPRAADVYAETDVEALTIDKNSFLHFIQGTRLEKTLRHLSEVRDSTSWDVLSGSAVFRHMTSYQKTRLETIMHSCSAEKGEFLFKEKEKLRNVYIPISGNVSLIRDGDVIKRLDRGDFIGEIFAVMKEASSPFSARADSECELYRIDRHDFMNFIQDNPGVYMRLLTANKELLS